MHDLINFLQTNAALVIANPTAFMIFAVLFGGGGFAVGRYFLAERIANLESRIARRDDEIKELKSERPRGEGVEEQSFVPILSTSFIDNAMPVHDRWLDRRRPMKTTSLI